VTRVLSGNHAGWLTTIAKEVREAGKPVSLDHLCSVVPGQFATSINDGHVTAAENGLPRNDYRAGQRIWVEEAVTALAKAGLVLADNGRVTWAAGQDGTWKVRFGRSSYTVYGQAESFAARDRHMLGFDVDQPGYLLKGFAEAEVEVEVGAGDEIRKGRHTFQVHPLASAIPPMSPAEQEQVRADIAEHGVRLPLILYPDPSDKTARGKPKLKVLDGRHRLQFASVLGKPVRVELFVGSEVEARAYVASMNLHRRQLTAAQRALAIERLFGEQARREAKEAQIRKPKLADSVRSSLTTQTKSKSESIRWEHRAVKLAGGTAGVSPTSVRHMAKIVQAPETVAKVESGEIPTVSGAAREAARELGEKLPENVWKDTFHGEIARARGHLRKALELPVNHGSSELDQLTDELVKLANQVREIALRIAYQ
jgi:hypothetical protein